LEKGIGKASKMPSKKSALLCIHTKGEKKKKKKKKKTCRAAPREARCVVPDGAIATHRYYHPLRAVVLPTQEERRRPQTGAVKRRR
tara:strand:+ start:204 stop:461 length:258 start_codon:yes stop_codon:yes gene_type:complete